jgi:hypothetical protein
MRAMIMHRTSAHWEAGGLPGKELIERVGGLVGELASAGVLLGAEGLRPSSEGVRLRFSGGERQVQRGPYAGDNELPAGFTIVAVASLDDAIELASRQADILGDVELDIRPVTEPWDIGLAPRPEPPPPRRYMILRKATAAFEAGQALSTTQRAALSALTEGARGVHRATVELTPSRRGRRYKNSRDGVRVVDGPFTESKELVGGYILVTSPSLEEASRLALRYVEVVGAEEADLREVRDVG